MTPVAHRQAVTTQRPREVVLAIGRFLDWLDARPRLCIALAAVALVISAFGYVAVLILDDWTPRLGIDYRTYTAAAERFMAGDSFYWPWQLAGPYRVPVDVVTDIARVPVLYPPWSLALLIPGVLMPAVLWWTIPLTVLAWHVVRCNPRRSGWVLIAILASYYNTGWLILSGNPMMWSVMALIGGLRLGWPGALVLVKPTLAPFALVGIRTPGWWVAAGALGAVGLLAWPLWSNYLTAVLNASTGRTGILYSLSDVPLMLIPLVAWWTRR